MQEEKNLLDDILSNSHSGKANRFKSIIEKKYSPSVSDMYLTSKGYTQAILKISSYGKGSHKVSKHLGYISRNGKLELEDQDGNLISGLEEQESLINEWMVDFSDDAKGRDTLHMILSTPPGSSSENALNAAREFLTNEFSHNNEYIFVMHTDTDHPHIHCVIKLRGLDGLKLNPRKADLARYRKSFAKSCRQRGIKVEASRRFERGLPGKAKKTSFYRMNQRGKKPLSDLKLEQKIKVEIKQENPKAKAWEDKMLTRNQVIRRRYIEEARKAGRAHGYATDEAKKNMLKDVALSLDKYARNLPLEKPRYHDIKLEESKLQGKDVHNMNNQFSATTLEREYSAIKKEITALHQSKDNKEKIKSLDKDFDVEI
ncbi:MAG: hypothetical protein LEGION0398_MBIBDBAK_01085 [Legionellaceae bacterium]